MKYILNLAMGGRVSIYQVIQYSLEVFDANGKLS